MDKYKRHITKIVNSFFKEGKINKFVLVEKDPKEYKSSIVLTNQILELAIDSGVLTSEILNKSIDFMLKKELEKEDPIPWLISKLNVLKYGKSEICKKETKETLKLIKESQKRDGGFSETSGLPVLDNSFALYFLSQIEGTEKIREKLIKWLKSNKASDGKGWGRDKFSKSEPTFTASVVLSLITAGEKLENKIVKEGINYLAKNKELWQTSQLTGKKQTLYSVSQPALVLKIAGRKFNFEAVEDFIERNFLKTKTIYMLYWAMRYLKIREICKESNCASRYLEYLRNLKKEAELQYYISILNSKVLGSTQKAIERRKEIIKILSKYGEMDVAKVIDYLKKKEEFKNLNKKYHITQIKADLEHLREMGIVFKNRIYYYTYFNFIED